MNYIWIIQNSGKNDQKLSSNDFWAQIAQTKTTFNIIANNWGLTERFPKHAIKVAGKNKKNDLFSFNSVEF